MNDYLTLCRGVYRGMLDDGADPNDDGFLRDYCQRLRLFGGMTRLVSQMGLNGEWCKVEVFARSFRRFKAGSAVPGMWLQ